MIQHSKNIKVLFIYLLKSHQMIHDCHLKDLFEFFSRT